MSAVVAVCGVYIVLAARRVRAAVCSSTFVQGQWLGERVLWQQRAERARVTEQHPVCPLQCRLVAVCR